MMNMKQRLAYDFVIPWINLNIENDLQDHVNPKRKKKLRPLYLNVCGKAGTGKSFFLLCLQKYLFMKGIKNFMKIGALTASASFLVHGSTLHRLLKLPVNISKAKELPKLDGASLHALQKEFETVELLVIDEKSMIGQFLFYMINARLKELKPNSADEPFGALQSLTGKVQVFYRDFPVYSFPLTCFGSVQGLKGQISLKYREIHTFCTGISILYLHSCLCFYNRDFPVLRKTTTWNFAKTGKTL